MPLGAAGTQDAQFAPQAQARARHANCELSGSPPRAAALLLCAPLCRSGLPRSSFHAVDSDHPLVLPRKQGGLVFST